MSDEREIQAVIFDMDGVLTDSEPLISAAAMAMFKEKGLTVQAEDFLPFVGAGEDRYIGGVAEKYNFPLDVSSAKKRTYEIYLELVPSRLNAFPGAVELVRACRNAGLKVAVASSADRIKLNANLRKIGLPPEMWDAIVTAEDVVHKEFPLGTTPGSRSGERENFRRVAGRPGRRCGTVHTRETTTISRCRCAWAMGLLDDTRIRGGDCGGFRWRSNRRRNDLQRRCDVERA